MIKEIVILAIAFLALCSALPVEDTKPEVVAVAVPVETAQEPEGDAKDEDDLAPAASAWGGGYGRRYGGGWGRGYGGGWGGGWGRGYGGWGGRGYGGWGRGNYWG